ncbi:MAG: hypothetical protein ACREKM_00240 [Longimicrobiales bacterium]
MIAAPTTDVNSGIRRLLFALVGLGTLGLIAELVLLEHYEEWQQWLPLAGLSVGLLALVGIVVWPGRVTVRAFQAIMAAFVVLGGIGVYLHFAGNIEFELEMAPDLGGAALVWSALRGATPALAPGALAQVGLLGLAATIRHPAMHSPRQARTPR